MEEPTCGKLFDFEYERVFGTQNIPKADLQAMMYADCKGILGAEADVTADVQKGIENLWLKDKDGDGKEEPAGEPQDVSHRK